jgi:hypothetical protein
MDLLLDKHFNVPLVLNGGVGKHRVLAVQQNAERHSSSVYFIPLI